LKLRAQTRDGRTIWLDALEAPEELLVNSGQFGQALVACYKNPTQYAVMLMESTRGWQKATMKVPRSDGSYTLLEFDPMKVGRAFVDSGGFCAVDYERRGRVGVVGPPTVFTETSIPTTGGWKCVVFWVIDADDLLKACRFLEILFWDGTHGVCNRDLIVMLPCTWSSAGTVVGSGIIFFGGEDTRCCDFLITVAAVLLWGPHLRRVTAMRTDGNLQLGGACTKGIQTRLFGQSPTAIFWIVCWVSATSGWI
jgi:hypothetical protein